MYVCNTILCSFNNDGLLITAHGVNRSLLTSGCNRFTAGAKIASVSKLLFILYSHGDKIVCQLWIWEKRLHKLLEQLVYTGMHYFMNDINITLTEKISVTDFWHM